MLKYQLFSNRFPPTHLSLARQTDSSASKLTLLVVLITVVLNQIKSNNFYCHITTAQVPWWVKFLRACSRQCKKQNNLHMDSTYLQTVQKTVQNTHTYTQYTQCTIKTYLVTNTHYTPYVHVCIMYTSIHSNMWRCNRLYIYNRLVVQKIVVQRCNRLCICNVVDVLCMVSSDSRCVSAVCACSPVELC